MAHPVLDTVLPVVRNARDVSLDLDRLAEHAGWMAYEELPPPAFEAPPQRSAPTALAAAPTPPASGPASSSAPGRRFRGRPLG